MGKKRKTRDQEVLSVEEQLSRIPPGERRSWLPLLPGGGLAYWLAYFRAWRTLRWSLLLLLPVLASAGAAFVRGRNAAGTGVLVFGSAISMFLFVDLLSGMASSNIGTYLRRTEPVRYWLSVAAVGLIYLALSIVGYWM